MNESKLRWVKASELPKRDGYYSGTFVHLPVVIDIQNGAIHSLSFAEGKVRYTSLEPLTEQEKEWLEWLDEGHEVPCKLCGEISDPTIYSGCDRSKEIGCNWHNHEVPCMDEALASVSGKGGEPEDAETFPDYVIAARDKFVRVINSYERSIELRVACEDILIAYDQMRDKLLSTKGGESEGEAKPKSLYKYQGKERRKMKKEVARLNKGLQELPILIDCSRVYGDNYFNESWIDPINKRIAELKIMLSEKVEPKPDADSKEGTKAQDESLIETAFIEGWRSNGKKPLSELLAEFKNRFLTRKPKEKE